MKVKEIYASGGNIIKYLKEIGKNELNTIEDILISYDFQAGSYIKNYFNNMDFVNQYCGALAQTIMKLGNFTSIIEAGVGEGTTLAPLLQKLNSKKIDKHGFDISWSRLKYARNFLNDFSINNVNLFAANLFEIPLAESSIDIVYTSHSIEPNGGKEKEALRELYRITNKYLVLLEPSYEFANEEARHRMRNNGYTTNLYTIALELGYKVVEHRLFDYSSNLLNPTGLIIIEKNQSKVEASRDLRCPVTLTPLQNYNDDLLYSKESFLAYPVIQNIPCLLKENAVLAIHLLSDYSEFKKENNIK